MTRIRIATYAAVLGVLVAGVLAVARQTVPRTEIALVDRDGTVHPAGQVPDSIFALRVSPNGKQVAFDASDGRDVVVWIYDLTGSHAMRRLTTGSGSRYPMWSSDGEWVLFNSDREGFPQLFRQRADGATPAERLTDEARAPESWSAPNSMFSFIMMAGSDYDVWTYSLRDRKSSPLIANPSSAQHSSSFSPDGKWIAYMSEESGRSEVYVQPFPISGTKTQITKNGGTRPLWSPDGKELFYDNGSRLFSLDIRTTPAFTATDRGPLPITGFIQGTLRRQYDITPDGKQFVMLFRRQ